MISKNHWMFIKQLFFVENIIFFALKNEFFKQFTIDFRILKRFQIIYVKIKIVIVLLLNSIFFIFLLFLQLLKKWRDFWKITFLNFTLYISCLIKPDFEIVIKNILFRNIRIKLRILYIIRIFIIIRLLQNKF